MSVVEYRIQKIFAVHRIPSDLLDSWTLSFRKYHAIKKLIAFLNADVFSYDIINVIIGIEHLYLEVKQTRFTFDPYKIARLLVKQNAIDINLHI